MNKSLYSSTVYIDSKGAKMEELTQTVKSIENLWNEILSEEREIASRFGEIIAGLSEGFLVENENVEFEPKKYVVKEKHIHTILIEPVNVHLAKVIIIHHSACPCRYSI